MNDIQNRQEQLFTALKTIQYIIVNEMLINSKQYDTKDLLYETTYNTIYSIMEMLDGYSDYVQGIDLIDKETGQSLKCGIELHDKCSLYLQYKQDNK